VNDDNGNNKMMNILRVKSSELNDSIDIKFSCKLQYAIRRFYWPTLYLLQNVI